jgi:hypothetical protein
MDEEREWDGLREGVVRMGQMHRGRGMHGRMDRGMEGWIDGEKDELLKGRE